MDQGYQMNLRQKSLSASIALILREYVTVLKELGSDYRLLMQ
jgi:hypothetical protein